MSDALTDAHRKAGAAWDGAAAGSYANWWEVPGLAGYVDGRIAEALLGPGASGEGGVPAILRTALGEAAPLGLGVSIGCGSGGKERGLLAAGVVERMRLFEVSPARLARAEEAAAAEGLGPRVDCVLADGFAVDHPPYDLVYWDHALHHMFDVDRAVAWSVAALRPGGWLFVNDYIGPTRLQWPWAQSLFVRRALIDVSAHLPAPIRRPRFRTPLDRWRLKRRDPSEAPQSDRIAAAIAAHAPGMRLAPLGGAVLNIAGHALATAPGIDAAIDRVIAWDREAEARGYVHFAAGLWQKPA